MLNFIRMVFIVITIIVFYSIHSYGKNNYSKQDYLGKGKVSHFGGPSDKNVGKHSKTAISGEKARNLNPNDFYCAFRWNYKKYPKNYLKKCLIKIECKKNGQVKTVTVKPKDYGPHPRTGRIIDVSPGAMKKLGIKTDDTVTVYLIHPTS